MLTIYHWEPNANSGKPILAAFEKGVEFESRYVDMQSLVEPVLSIGRHKQVGTSGRRHRCVLPRPAKSRRRARMLVQLRTRNLAFVKPVFASAKASQP
jgi:hypothetical protein